MSYWCIGNDEVGRPFSIELEAPDDATMWNRLDTRFGGPVSRNGLKIAEMTESWRVKRPVFGFAKS